MFCFYTWCIIIGHNVFFFLLSEGLTIREGFNKKAERSCLSVLLIFFSGALAASLCLFGPERLFILEGGLLFCFFCGRHLYLKILLMVENIMSLLLLVLSL